MSRRARCGLALALALALGANAAHAGRAEGIAAFDRGQAHHAQGAFVDAAAEFRRALHELSPPLHRDAGDRALALEALARVELELGDLANAAVHIEALLELRDGRLVANHPKLARAWNLAGALAHVEGRRDDALAHFQRAKDIYRSIHGNLHPRVAASLANEGLVLEERPPLKLAWICFRQSVDILRACGVDGAGLAEPLVNLARVERKMGELGAARRHYLAALEAAGDGIAAPVAVRAWHGLALCSLDAGDPGIAREELHAAGMAWDAWRSDAGQDLRAARSLRPPWPELAWLEHTTGDEGAAWDALAATYGRGAWRPGEDELVVVWLRVEPGEGQGGSRLLGCSWRGGAARRWWNHDIPADSLVALGGRWREALMQGRPAPEEGRQLARWLWPEGWHSALDGVRSVRLVPPAELGGLPLEALPVGRSTLGERVATHYAPAPGFEAPPVRGGPVLVVADPRASSAAGPVTGAPVIALRSALAGDPLALARLQPLVHAGREAREVAALWPGSTLLSGKDATAQALRGRAASGGLVGWSLVHVATHALVDPARPWASALVLGEEPLGPGDLLRVGEVAREWRLDGSLVVLSACDTGVSAGSWSGGGLGFPAAFLEAGASGVVVSLWKVEDHATREFMSAFHRGLRESPGADEALRSARREVPGVWMVLVGGG